jgi:cold shock CspA family protein
VNLQNERCNNLKKNHVDHLQDGYKVETGKDLSFEEEEDKKEKNASNVHIT